MNKHIFSGFSDHETFTRLPDSFFSDLLVGIDDLDELKATLYTLWCFEHMEGSERFLRLADFSALLPDPSAALEKTVQRGTLLKVSRGGEPLFFLNSPHGRTLADGYASGRWSPANGAGRLAPPLERPNIFKLYEENLGPLTPLLADALKDAEQEFPFDWLREAVEIAVKSNKRSWKYVEAILRRWKEEGHAKEQDRRDTQEHRGREVERNVAEFFKQKPRG
jgi:DnaD/phage-associated family protein